MKEFLHHVWATALELGGGHNEAAVVLVLAWSLFLFVATLATHYYKKEETHGT